MTLETRTQGIQVARFAVVYPGAHMLMVQRSHNAKNNPGLWEFAGGQMDPEDPNLTVAGIREVKEETEISIRPIVTPEHVYTYPMTGGAYEGQPHSTSVGIARWLGGDIALQTKELQDYALPTFEQLRKWKALTYATRLAIDQLAPRLATIR